jgi:ABC-type transporter Mla subunit MlaD
LSPPGTAREALLAEALGELGQLLDRLEDVAPRIDAAAHTLNLAAGRLDTQARELDRHLASFAERVQVQAVRHIACRTDELARHSLTLQTRAMEAAALAAFERAAEGAHQRVPKQAASAGDLPGSVTANGWLIALVSALLSSAATWWLAWWWTPWH